MNNCGKWLPNRGYSEEKYREKIERNEMFISNSQKEINTMKNKISYLTPQICCHFNQVKARLIFVKH